jgi:hypothetical protein
MADREIDIDLNLKAKNSADTISRIKLLEDVLSGLEDEADAISLAMTKATKSGAEFAKLSTSLEVTKNAMRSVKNEINALSGPIERAKKAQDQYLASVNRTREAAQKLQQVGTRLAVAGAAIVAPLVASVKKYSDSVGDGERTSRKLIEASERWEDVQVRIGRVTAEQILPALDKALDITEKIAAYAEKNPDAIKGVLTIGASLAAAGALVTTVSQVVSTAATLKGLAAGAGMAGGTSGAGAVGTVALYASAVIIGAEAGLAIGNAINRAIGQPEQTRGQVFETAKMVSAMALPVAIVSYALKAAGFDEAAAKVWNFAKAANGLGDAAKESTGPVQAAGRVWNAERVKMEADIIKASRKNADDRLTIEQQTADKIKSLQSGTFEKIAAAASGLRQALDQIDTRYVADRAKIIRDGGREIERIEQAHQKRMAQIKKTFDRAAGEATRNRDALALVEAQRAYEDERQDEISNTNDEISQRRQDIAIRLQDLDQSYRAERQTRINAYNQQVLELQESEKRQILLIRQAEQQKLQELTAAYQKQIQMIRSAFGIGGTTSPNRYGGSTNVPGRERARAEGGYMSDGLWRVGERGDEFALSNQTTRAAENIIGGKLTQERLLSALTMNVNLGQGMTIMQAKRMMAGNNRAMLSEVSSAFGSL